MRWVKLHATLHRHIAFRRQSPGSRLVFYTCLEIAGDLEQEGALFVRGAGPMTVAEIAVECGVSEAHTLKGLESMVSIGFMARRPDGAYLIEKWDEKTAPSDPTAAERKQRSRAKSRVTPVVTNRDMSRVHTHSQEEEVEEEVDSVTEVTAPAWVSEVTESVRSIKLRELRSLSADERFTLARYHALRFAGCTKSEPTNRRKAVALATSLVNLSDRISRNADRADLTVDEYVALAARLAERSQVLLHTAMDVLPEIELEATA